MLQFPLNITPLCLSLPRLLNKQPQIPTCINSPYRGHLRKKTINNIIWERLEVRLKTQNI